MSRYIDADKFKKYILDRYNTMEMVGINQVVNFITEQPTADVKEVVRGEWKEENENTRYTQTYICSMCGQISSGFKTNFCFNCGADMRDIK